MKNDLILISRGPQYQGGNAVALFFFAAILIICAIISLIQMEILTFSILLLITTVVVNFILDIQGVDIDKGKNQVRPYKLFLLWKFGEWQDLSPFYCIGLHHMSYTVKQLRLYDRPAYFGSEINYCFLISLLHEDPEKNIVLAEEAEYKSGITTALKLSAEIGLGFEDLYKDKVIESKRNRRKR